MKITVKHKGTEISIDRPNFVDFNKNEGQNVAFRTNLMNDSIIPELEKIVEKIKELTKDEM